MYPFLRERGLSVPDAELLEALSEALETPVSVLLGENVVLREERTEVLAKKLEEINFQLARRKERERKALHWFFLLACAGIAAGFLLLFFLKKPLSWLELFRSGGGGVGDAVPWV